MKDLESRTVKIDDVNTTLAPLFSGTFGSLIDVRSTEERKKRAKAERDARSSQSQAHEITTTSSSSQGRKRPPESLVAAESSKRIRTSDEPVVENSPPQTPNRPTATVDPKFSRTTVESGASIQSKDEENTRTLANRFIRDSMAALGPDFEELRWQKSGLTVVMAPS